MQRIQKLHSSLKRLAILVVFILASCAPDGQSVSPSRPLRIEYSVWWGDYTILIAQQLALFKKYGVEVEAIQYQPYETSFPDLAAGVIDGGMYTLDDAINVNDRSPVKVVAVYDDGGFNYVVGSPEINSPEDLRGKRIGVNIGSIGELFVLQTLEAGGLTFRDVILVDMSGEDVPASLGSTVDAGYVWEPFATEALNRGANLLLKKGGTDTITPDVIVFNAQTIQQRPDDIRKFLQAWFEAAEFRLNNPEQANLLISQTLGISSDDLTTDAQLFTLENNKVIMSDQQVEGVINFDVAFKENVSFLLRLGTLSRQPGPEEIIDSSFLP